MQKAIVNSRQQRSVMPWGPSVVLSLLAFPIAAASDAPKTPKGAEAPPKSDRLDLYGKRLLAGGKDKTFRLWDATADKQVRRFQGHRGDVRALAVVPGGKQIVSASADHTLRLWDADTGRFVREFSGHSDFVEAVAVSP